VRARARALLNVLDTLHVFSEYILHVFYKFLNILSYMIDALYTFNIYVIYILCIWVRRDSSALSVRGSHTPTCAYTQTHTHAHTRTHTHTHLHTHQASSVRGSHPPACIFHMRYILSTLMYDLIQTIYSWVPSAPDVRAELACSFHYMYVNIQVIRI